MLTERTTTLFVSIFYFQKCQTRDYILVTRLLSSLRPAYSAGSMVPLYLSAMNFLTASEWKISAIFLYVGLSLS